MSGTGTISPTGSSAPLCASITIVSSADTPMPSPIPTADATAPTIDASTSTAPTICRRRAPSAAISASSPVRCATRIENVLRIRKIPTSSDSPENPSSTIRTISPNALPFCGGRRRQLVTGPHGVPAAEHGRDLVLQLGRGTPRRRRSR